MNCQQLFCWMNIIFFKKETKQAPNLVSKHRHTPPQGVCSCLRACDFGGWNPSSFWLVITLRRQKNPRNSQMDRFWNIYPFQTGAGGAWWGNIWTKIYMGPFCFLKMTSKWGFSTRWFCMASGGVFWSSIKASPVKLRMLCTSNSEGKVVGNTGIPGTGMEGWKAVFNPHTHILDPPFQERRAYLCETIPPVGWEAMWLFQKMGVRKKQGFQ